MSVAYLRRNSQNSQNDVKQLSQRKLNSIKLKNTSYDDIFLEKYIQDIKDGE